MYVRKKEVRPNGESSEVSVLLRSGWAVSGCRTEQSLVMLTEVVVSDIPKQKQPLRKLFPSDGFHHMSPVSASTFIIKSLQ